METADLREYMMRRGPEWIREQAAALGARAIPVRLPPPPSPHADRLREFFGQAIERARIIMAPIPDPEWYRELLERGADPRDLFPFSQGAGITFDDVIVVNAGVQLTPELLAHELVHVVQYSVLGVERFAELYVEGWFARRDLIDDPLGRYESVPLEAQAYEIQRRFERGETAIPVEADVRRHFT